MTYMVFIQGLAITMLFSLAFMLGGYISFKIIHTQHQKERKRFKEDIFLIDNLKDKLKDAVIKLFNSKENNSNIISLYDNLLADVLSEIEKEVSYEDKELAKTNLEKYIEQRKQFDQQE